MESVRKNTECDEVVHKNPNHVCKRVDHKYQWNAITDLVPGIYFKQFPFMGTQKQVAEILGKFGIINGSTPRILNQRLNSELLWGRRCHYTLIEIFVVNTRPEEQVKDAYDYLKCEQNSP